MRSVLLAPHNDDETLFAAFTLQRVQPHVIVCTRCDHDHRRREDETQKAVQLLTGSATYEQWTFQTGHPDWKRMTQAIASLDEYDVVFAPAFNHRANGHAPGAKPPPGWGVLQHDHIGWLAHRHLGAERVVHYCLYNRWGGERDRRGTEVEPTAVEIIRKLKAISLYESQIESDATRAWFFDRLDLREWRL